MSDVAIWSTLGYLFFSVIPHATAPKHICSGVMLVSLGAQLIASQLKVPRFSWLGLAFMTVIFVSFLSSILSPYFEYALANFRKETLTFAIALLLLTCQCQVQSVVGLCKKILAAIILGYSVKLLLAVWKGLSLGFVFSRYQMPDADATLPKYLEFFSTDSVLFLPFLISAVLFLPMRLWLRSLLWLVIVTAVGIVLSSGVRTAFLVMILELLIFLLIKLWSKKWLLVVALGALIVSIFPYRDRLTTFAVTRYVSLISPSTYEFGNDFAVSERLAILKSIYEISRDRPIIGYGPVWKKLPTIAEENGHLERWKSSDNPIDRVTYNYYQLGEGRVNPHNLLAHLLLEHGLLGVLSYLGMLLCMAKSAMNLWRKSVDPVTRTVSLASMVYVLAYFISGLSGGLWLPMGFLVVMATLFLCNGRALEK